MRHSRRFADEIVGFHAQQALEKALKAWLCQLGAQYPLTHELSRLLLLLETNGVDVTAFWPLDRFTYFAVQARYAEGSGTGPRLDRVATIAEVRALLGHVAAIVGDPKT